MKPTLLEADRAQVAGDYAGAIDLYRQLVAGQSGSFEAWYGLAAASATVGEWGDALAAYERALDIRPFDAGLKINQAEAMLALGHVTDAVHGYRFAVARGEAPLRAMALRNLACIAPGDPALDNSKILEIRRAWAAQQAGTLNAGRPHRKRGPRRLRIAYYGAFFAERNWMKMYMGVLNAHDRSRFEVNLIVDGDLPSAASGYLDRDEDRIWQVSGVPNDELARHIEAAEIDVLIDLNGYSHKSRLPLLVHRAAPLQIAWNGMYGTTGFPHVDVLIADDAVLPESEEGHYTERIYRVRHTYLPFNVFYETPEVAPPPSVRNGYITFGSLNSAYKLTQQTLDIWSQLLRQIPSGRLLLRNSVLDGASNRLDLISRFANLGVGSDRLTLLGKADHQEFLRTYDEIDIALDVFPYNGGTTTAEALWQGVPVVTFNGDRWAGRTSRSILNAAGLSEWVGDDVSGFIEIARGLVDADLASIRLRQRQKIATSPACDVTSLCRELETLYRVESERLADVSITESGARP